MNQKRSKVATPSKQNIPMGLEDTALNKDAAVTEEVPLTLLIELKKQFGQVARHLHGYTLVGSARTAKREK